MTKSKTYGTKPYHEQSKTYDIKPYHEQLVTRAELIMQLDVLKARISKLEHPDPNHDDKLTDRPNKIIVAELFDALSREHKIEAIKAYRELTGEGLLESKNAIEAFLGAIWIYGH